MPEGPIIVILKEKTQQFIGQTVVSATSDKDFDTDILTGKTIVDIKSWGKHFLICFSEFTIRVHLMMFGTWRINEHSLKRPRLHLGFKNGELNFYACQLQMITQPLNEIYDWQADVMSNNWDAAKAIKKMKTIPNLMACDALMDQQIFSGVGNIIKNEVLFRIRVHPESLVAAMPSKKIKEMVTEAVNYSFEFLEQKKASTLSKHWLAYDKKECPRDHVPFIRKDTGKGRRNSYYCELCQVLYTDTRLKE
jgi:endonuclease-8